MSQLDREMTKAARRNLLPKDQRFVVKVHETNIKHLKEKIEQEEAEQDMLDFEGGDLDVTY